MPIIAMSGQPGCGLSTITERLAHELGLEYFSAGNYYKRQAGGSSKEAVEYWKTDKGSSSTFHNYIEKLVAEQARNGDIVIDGKLAVHFLKNNACTVWLKAPADIRAKRYAERDKLPEKEAADILNKKEKIERENWKKIYGFDYFDQEYEADIVIDTGNKRPDDVVRQIIGFIGKGS